MSESPGPSLGATYLGESRCRFSVWAPHASKVDLHLLEPGGKIIPMAAGNRGYFHVEATGIAPGALYYFRLDDAGEYPDPASRFQPRGVHGPSQVVDPYFDWEDGLWQGIELKDCIIYEMHIGTFTNEGTFDGAIHLLGELIDLGITAIELMPVAQFPGSRNWGYDGVDLFAVHNTYGGPSGLKRFVNACHQRGMAVVLDVVYNHLGPEGNYLARFGPYFTERYKTPWGAALNFDGPQSDEVRRFFVENALDWITDFHIDALRLDAIHAIMDHSAVPFLQNLGEEVHTRGAALGRRVYAIPESALNDTRLIRPGEQGGFGLDAQWNDDFHHALRTILTGNRSGYYMDFGTISQLVKAYDEGFVYSGQYSSYRQRSHGNSSKLIPANQFVVFSQNHDQVGNRMLGERLSQLVSFEKLKLAAAAVILSPFLPLLFMGEEYGETAPFQYFVDHSDTDLIEAVRRGRQEEFASFAWEGDPPDPQSEETFLRCRLNHQLQAKGPHKVLREFYRELLRLRRTQPALSLLSKAHMEVDGNDHPRLLFLRRWSDDQEVFILLHFDEALAEIDLPIPSGRWLKLLDSSEKRWMGAGNTLPELMECTGESHCHVQPLSMVLFSRLKDTNPIWRQG